jgi:hypothetical protein
MLTTARMIEILSSADRIGYESDFEGSLYIQMSDKLANEMIETLVEIRKSMEYVEE